MDASSHNGEPQRECKYLMGEIIEGRRHVVEVTLDALVRADVALLIHEADARHGVVRSSSSSSSRYNP